MDYISKDIVWYDVLGIPVSVVSLEKASAVIHAWSKDDIGRMVFIRDVHGMMQAYDHPELRELHQKSAMTTPDGMPLVWLGRAKGLMVERTSGPDLLPFVMEQSSTTKLRHYFYGGKPTIADRLKATFEARYPGVEIVRASSPPFTPLTDDELADVAEDIRASGAHVVWIGISTPKQERLMARLEPLVSATLIGVGAAFDFHSGAIKRAPKWMQQSGLEWLHRLASEPGRLWYRYVVMAPRFVFLVARDFLRRGAKDR